MMSRHAMSSSSAPAFTLQLVWLIAALLVLGIMSCSSSSMSDESAGTGLNNALPVVVPVDDSISVAAKPARQGRDLLQSQGFFAPSGSSNGRAAVTGGYVGLGARSTGGRSGGFSLPPAIVGTDLGTVFGLLFASGALDPLLPILAKEPFTFFVPTSKAIGNLAKALDVTLPELVALPQFPEIIGYHFVSGTKVLSKQIQDGTFITTFQGEAIELALTFDGRIFLNQFSTFPAQVIQPDIPLNRGVIHSIDAVLMPPGMAMMYYY